MLSLKSLGGFFFFFSLSGENVPILEVVQSGHSPLWGSMEVADGSGDHCPRVRVGLLCLESPPESPQDLLSWCRP